MEKAKGNQHMDAVARSHDTTKHSAPTLSAMGITRNQSSRWEQLANIPKAQFEQALAAPEKPSTKGIIRQHKGLQQEPMNPKALWLWERLRDNRIDGRGRYGELAPWVGGVLANHLGGLEEELRRNRQAKCLHGFQIDCKFDLGVDFDRQIRRLRPF